MKVHVFQIVTAVAEIDRASRQMIVRHGAYWPSRYFGTCDWSSPIIPRSIEGAREVIAEHLNSCMRFEWPLLPYPGYDDALRNRSGRPRLTARDILPGSNLDTDERLHFGVTTDTFDVPGLDDRVEIGPIDPQLLSKLSSQT